MVKFKIIYLLLFVVAIFLLYHLLGGCGCYNGVIEGFSVGGQNKIKISNLLSLSYIPECNPSPPSPPSPPESLFKCEYKNWLQCYFNDVDDNGCNKIDADPDETYPIDIPSYWKIRKEICIPVGEEKYDINASCIYHASCKSGACKKEEGEDIGVCVEGINCSGKYDCKNCIKEYDISQYPKGNGKECPHSVTCSSEDKGCKEFEECNSNASCNLGEICVVNKCLNCSDITIHAPNNNEKFIPYASYLCKQYKEYCDIYKRDSYKPSENKYICRTKECPTDRVQAVDGNDQYIDSCSKINNKDTCNKTKIVKCNRYQDDETCPNLDYSLYELCHYINNTCTNINSEGNINYCRS